eukprot:366006-Chlamydomonas_euryale.AAC.3
MGRRAALSAARPRTMSMLTVTHPGVSEIFSIDAPRLASSGTPRSTVPTRSTRTSCAGMQLRCSKKWVPVALVVSRRRLNSDT